MKHLSAADRAAFIRLHTRLLPVPLAQEIILHLAHEATELWQKTEDELDAIGLPPPFWAFAWAGGQALARHILDNPDLVRERRVLDFASGSGLVAIAAMHAGAISAEAADIDAFAQTAIDLNAAANGVRVDVAPCDVMEAPRRWDVVLAGDIAYEADMAARCFGWLETLAQDGAGVLIGDPGRSFLPKEKLGIVASYEIPVTRALEDSEIKRTSVWQFS